MNQYLFSSQGVDLGPRALTLSQFAAAIGAAVHQSPALQGVWVTAELSDVRFRGGHCYMELLEKDPAGNTLAKMRANIWAGSLSYVRRKFGAATGRDLCAGIKVMLYGNATHHAVYGFSFNIGDIDPSYTMGDLERQRREILARLTREGIIDRNRSMRPPFDPQRIAVISAAGAAGYGDFVNQLSGNADGYVFYPVLFESIMQGDRTSVGVRGALDRIESHADKWDCVVIIRGGGATTDMNGFDDYELARRVALCPLPVIVGIGHERDRTVLDEIACVRCKTPTAVAAWLVDALRGAWSAAVERMNYVSRYVTDRLAGEQQRLASIESLIPAWAAHQLSQAQTRLQKVATRLPSIALGRTADARARLEIIQQALHTASDSRIRDRRRQLDDLAGIIERESRQRISEATAKIDSLDSLVRVLDPANTLRRGYSVTRVGGHAVSDATTLAAGTILETTLANGKITSKIIE